MCAAIRGMASLKITLKRVDVGDLSRGVQRESRRRVHPGVRGDDRGTPEDAGQHDRHTGPEVRPGLQPSPSEDVDRDEDRLGEEEEPLERERHPERLTPLPHEAGPQQAELEAQHRARHRPDGERHRHVLRPTLGQQQGIGVVTAECPVVGDQGHERPRHPERHEDDVERQRERHLCPRPRDGIHGEHTAERHGGPVAPATSCAASDPEAESFTPDPKPTMTVPSHDRARGPASEAAEPASVKAYGPIERSGHGAEKVQLESPSTDSVRCSKVVTDSRAPQPRPNVPGGFHHVLVRGVSTDRRARAHR